VATSLVCDIVVFVDASCSATDETHRHFYLLHPLKFHSSSFTDMTPFLNYLFIYLY